MAAAYSLKIITPQGIAYEGSVYHALVPAESGFVGVLAHHAPYLLSSKGGRMVVKESIGLERDFEVGPGFFEVQHDQAVFLTATVTENK